MFCESCEQLDITHPSIHMTRRFVIQGPTLGLLLSTSSSAVQVWESEKAENCRMMRENSLESKGKEEVRGG